MANFRTKARAIDLLGKNQIADLPTAITELWKNGYDAYGDYLGARLFVPGYQDINYTTFMMMDDGHGMTKEDILSKWIVLGTDSKKNVRNKTPEQDRFGKEERVPLGEKGIGRLSVSYLGNQMLLITKKEGNPYELLFMNWSILDNYDLFVEDIDIPIDTVRSIEEISDKYKQLQNSFKENFSHGKWDDFVDLKDKIYTHIEKYNEIPVSVMNELKEHYEKFGHGTCFVIFDPIEEICSLAENAGTSTDDNNNNYMKASLNGLFNPFDSNMNKQRKTFLDKNNLENSPEILILSEQRNYEFLINANYYDEQDFEQCEHYIDGEINEYGEFNGKIKVYGEIKSYFFSPMRKKKITKFKPISIHIAFWEPRFDMTSLTPQRYKYYEDKSELFGGINIYRDGFRVLPYGRKEFDFLGFEERRSRHAGNYYFSHRKMFGYIGIGKYKNPDLIDKSGREGLINNAAYREMRSILIEFFTKIAKDYYGTQSEVRQERRQVADEKKVARKLIEAEKKENRKQLVEFRKTIKDRTEKIKELTNRILDFSNEIQSYIEQPLFQREQKKLLSHAYTYQDEIRNLRVQIPPRLALSDKDKDIMYEFEEMVEANDTKINQALNLIYINTYQNELAQQYEDKYKKIKENINKSFYENTKCINDQLQRIKGEIDEFIKGNTKIVEAYSPEVKDINNQTKETTKNYLMELEKLYNIDFVEWKDSLILFEKHMQNISLYSEDQRLLGIYKETQDKLAEKVEQLHELAQLGMAVEIIDHQFNVMYEQITRDLHILKKYERKFPEEGKDSLKKLDIYIKHLEGNYKLLVPLYMTSRRSKKNITGEDIKQTILDFYGEKIEKNGIVLECDNSFLNYSILTFESIIMPIFINIINNAVFWLEKKDRKVIRIEVNQKREILIMNSGEKMKHSELLNCFQLFYTNKPQGRGIGLYLAKENLRKINLDIYATDDKEYNKLNGACFVICELQKGE